MRSPGPTLSPSPRSSRAVAPRANYPASSDFRALTRSLTALAPSRRPSGEPVLAEGDVVVRVATSVAVDVSSTCEVVPKPLAEFDIALETRAESGVTP